MPVVTAEDLAQFLASSIEVVWEAEWRRADLSRELVKLYNKAQIKVIANHIGRSHQDVFRWASLAGKFPPPMRRLDRSPRDHTKAMNLYEKTGKPPHGWEYLSEKGQDAP